MSEGHYYVILFVVFCVSLNILKAAAKNDKKPAAAAPKPVASTADLCFLEEHSELYASSCDHVEKLLAENAAAIHAPETADFFGNDEVRPNEAPKVIDYSVPAVFRKQRLLVV